MKLFKQTPVALIVMAMCSSAFSQSAANSSTANDTVVISGSRSASKLSETAASIGLVTRAQWDEEKPKSVGDIINRIPGVFWNDLGNEQHSMSIRQPISTNAVYQYLEDGIPIRPLGVFNHNALNENNMNAASGVEVVKGAASSLYGSNAVGGAVNFLTQRASKTPTGYLGVRVDDTDGFTPRVRHQMTQVVDLYRASFKLATTKGSIERFALVFSGSNSPALWLACR